ncbi:MAG TPA: cysteine desulfurase family protein [Candidatus Limnocylindrales bacterium]|nr:cysteine desulfurase family protein [Candidatus Limnocylindrales bacterium]
MTTAAIYLDHAATTPLRPEALEAMLPLLGEHYGNPSSPHAAGRRARAALDEARERLARVLAAEPREIVFTGGGSEAINLALKGAAWAGKARGNRIIASAADHHAVLHTLAHLEKFGFEIVHVGVDRYGRLDLEQLAAAMNDRTILVSLLLANNEVGTLQPLDEAVRLIRAHAGVAIHVDAVAAAGYVPLDVGQMDLDMLSLAGHKMEGPKGIGALYLRRGTVILPQVHGGAQERFRRAGTENVAGALGMAVAFELAAAERPATVARLGRLRDRLRDAVLGVAGVELTGHQRHRLPGHLSIIVRDIDGQELVVALDLEGVQASVGSACTTGSLEPSHVLTAMGYPEDEARGSLRLTLGRATIEEEIDSAVRIVPSTIARLRAIAPAVSRERLGERVTTA